MSSPSSSPAQLASPGNSRGPSGQKCVVLVDDEPAYIDLLEQMLAEHISCPVRSYTAPEVALQAVPTLDVGLIVTDYYMPAMSGFELLVEVRKMKPGLPSIMISGHPVELTPEWEQRLPDLKAVIRKPFRWTVLAREISQHWPGSRPPFAL